MLGCTLGKWTGFVTTTRVTHATPGAAYAKTPSRKWENDAALPPDARGKCKDIAAQLVDDNPNINVGFFNVFFVFLLFFIHAFCSVFIHLMNYQYRYHLFIYSSIYSSIYRFFMHSFIYSYVCSLTCIGEKYSRFELNLMLLLATFTNTNLCRHPKYN